MHVIRHLLALRRLSVLICTAALLLKLLIPTGYMIDDAHGQITVTICSGTGPTTMVMELPGMHDDASERGKSKDRGKAEMPCAFAGLSAAMMGAIDPIQLVALIAFVLAVGMLPVIAPVLPGWTRLRPPLRGPPAYL